jgi:peptidoglycan/LPS O-acetylase OafA/YrhL
MRHNGGMDLETKAWLRERIDGRLAAGVGIAWLVLLQVAFALEPTTHQPEPSYGVVLELTMWLLIATMATGLVMQRRWGLVASLAAAGFLTALSIACPISGHHPFGAWWYGQMACVLALGAISVVALRWSGDLPHWFPKARADVESEVESDQTM